MGQSAAFAGDDPGQLLTDAIDTFTAQVDATGKGDWARRSPCEGWDGLAVLDHVTDTLIGIIAMVSGSDYRNSKHGDEGRTSTPAQDVERWHTLADQATTAAADLDPATELSGPRGPAPRGGGAEDPHARPHGALLGPGRDGRTAPPAARAVAGGPGATGLQHPARVHASARDLRAEVKTPEGAGPTETAMAFLGRRRTG